MWGLEPPRGFLPLIQAVVLTESDAQAMGETREPQADPHKCTQQSSYTRILQQSSYASTPTRTQWGKDLNPSLSQNPTRNRSQV